MFNYLKFLTILLVINRCQGNNFVVFTDEDFLQPCDSSDNLGNLNFEEMLHINTTTEYADDMETIITNGNITFLVDLPENTLLSLHLEILEWRRGGWETTIFSIRRDDLCSALFDPTEFWYSLTKTIPEEDRVCPPKEGTVYRLKDMENRIELENVHGLELEGQYKVVSHILANNYATCVVTLVNIWKN